MTITLLVSPLPLVVSYSRSVVLASRGSVAMNNSSEIKVYSSSDRSSTAVRAINPTQHGLRVIESRHHRINFISCVQLLLEQNLLFGEGNLL